MHEIPHIILPMFKVYDISTADAVVKILVIIFSNSEIYQEKFIY